MAAHWASSMALAAVFLSVAMVVAQAATAGGKSDDGGMGNENPKVVDLVAEVCANLSNGLMMISRVHFHEKPCVSVLSSDNRSAVAKDHGDLVMVALDLMEHRSNKIAAKIDSMILNLQGHNRTKRAFQLCAADYANILRRLPVCRNIFLDLKPLGKKAKEDDKMVALGCMDRIGQAARDCASNLDHWHWDQTDEYYEVIRYISLAWGLMELATDYVDDRYNW